MGSSFASHFNVDYIDQMLRLYETEPESLEPTWRYFFEGMAFASSQEGPKTAGTSGNGDEAHVTELIRAYRKWGHLAAQIDPLAVMPAIRDNLALAKYGFSEADLDRIVPTRGFLASPQAPLRELIAALEATYCGPIGVEYLHGADFKLEQWFQERLEPEQNQPKLDLDTKRRILEKLNQAELFERFLHAKYVGQKRFSLEGGESIIPALAELLETLAELGAEEVVLGMAHRGRLNVLANIMGKTYQDIFTDFEPNYLMDAVQGDGDVKYHKGYVENYTTRYGKKILIDLADNPSHLEAVNPVVEGFVRAHQSLRHDENRIKVVPILIHGDASFAGQGIVSETLNMSQLEGYRTGGTVHIVINNQIGFTTLPQDSRSTHYCSDISRQILSPVFHVNGDDPEAVVHVIRLAAAFRQSFGRDVVVDLLCFRKHGHNESDEPSFTQPLMYQKIRSMPSVRSRYVEKLIKGAALEAQVAKSLEEEFQAKLQKALDLARTEAPTPKEVPNKDHYRSFQPLPEPAVFAPVNTLVSAERLRELARGLARIPEDFKANPKLLRMLQERLARVEAGTGIDWGNAETLAFASLLTETEPIPVRLSGQDVKRGTFSHRHAVLFDSLTNHEYCPLNQLSPDQARFSVFNSHLSELAVLGFEFGYSIAKPRALVIWEAQFGDFGNGAQIIIDQFISSSESKWRRVSDLVMLLPHGYEGQGPEHSSARLERYLQLCAQNNIQVANLTEPAQLFHALRRQVLRDFHKPLILMSPKSLLRFEKCVSRIEDFSERGFCETLPDPQPLPAASRLLLCSGKVAYDLFAKRESLGNQSTAILRVEQLYPFPAAQIREAIASYPNLSELVWVQEESKNMGAWHFMLPRLMELSNLPLRYVGREASASPAVGSLSKHQIEQADLVGRAFA